MKISKIVTDFCNLVRLSFDEVDEYFQLLQTITNGNYYSGPGRSELIKTWGEIPDHIKIQLSLPKYLNVHAFPRFAVGERIGYKDAFYFVLENPNMYFDYNKINRYLIFMYFLKTDFGSIITNVNVNKNLEILINLFRNDSENFAKEKDTLENYLSVIKNKFENISIMRK